MITYLKKEDYNFNTDRDKDAKVVEIACLSTDTKPTTGIVTGSICFEVNTGKIFMFDEAGGTW